MTTPPSSPLTVIQICGAGHSGSTLLGLLLGSHSSAFYLGEAKKARFVGDPNKPARKRGCKFCGDDCPVWGDYRWSDDENLYEAVAARTGASVLIDSTKGLSWLQKRSAELDALGHRRVVLFLTRDGRAVINSRLRKYPDRDLDGQIDQWVEQIESTSTFVDAQTGPTMQVQYEALATDPTAVLSAICDLAGIAFEPAMLAYESHEHHVLGGNNGTQFLAARDRDTPKDVEVGDRHGDYYASHDRGIHLDLRWLEELAPDALARFEARAGDLNAPMAWEAR